MVRYKQMYKVILKRFLKGFLSAGIASVVLVINSGVVIQSVSDLKVFLYSLAVAFISGALLATEKAINYKQ